MKKNLLYLLMMACMFTFFTACGDDDKDPEPPKTEETTWKDGLGTYEGDVFTIDGATAAKGQSVALAAGSGENAKITLTNIVPEEATLEIDNVVMTKDNANYSFTGEKKVGTTTIGVTGTLTGIPATKESGPALKTINIKVTRTMDASIAGTWKLGISEGEVPVADFRINTDLQFSNPLVNGLFTSVPTLVGGLISQKVAAVNVKLGTDGLFDVSWVKQGTTEEVNYKTAIKGLMAGNPNIPEMVGPILEGFLSTVGYFTKDDKLYLTFDKGIIDLALPLMGGMLPEGLTSDAILSLFEVSGNYYLLPINMDKDGDNFTFFYVDKKMVLSVLQIATPLLGGLMEKVPAEMLPMVQSIMEELPASLAAASECNIGLGFNK